MSWESYAYAFACVVVPVAWGLAVVWLSNRIESLVSRQRRGAEDARKKELPRIEYHI